jgi:hypothetical protein
MILDDESTTRAVLALLREAVTGTYGPPAVRASEMARAIWFVLHGE